jgi:mannose-1-phosphate guanylyltransferase
MRYGVIMAGGAGTRLWPLSRANLPKQLLEVVGGKSLLQLSYQRMLSLVEPGNIFVCTGESHRKAVLANLPDLPPENLLGEPVGRDTANAVGFPAAVLIKRDPDAVFAVVTADHVIEPVDVFREALDTGFRVVERLPNALVTFGIVPTHGHTGLGYIHRGEQLPDLPNAYKVHAFKEKPDKPTADRYVESGRYYWNSGMFVWRAETVLGEIQTRLPSNYEQLMRIAEAWDTPARSAVLNQVYPDLVRISIDYAVMEPASTGRGKAQVVVVEMPVQWLDIGSWPALAETLPVDDHENALDARVLVALDCDSNIVISRDPAHLVAMIGVSDMIVVHTPDITMICPKHQAERVKELVNRVRERYGEQYQ